MAVNIRGLTRIKSQALVNFPPTPSLNLDFTTPYVNGLNPLPSTVTFSRADIGAPSITLSVNQVLVGSSTTSAGTGNYGTWPLYIGGNNTGFFNDNIYGLIIRGASSSNTQIQATESWLNQKTKAY